MLRLFIPVALHAGRIGLMVVLQAILISSLVWPARAQTGRLEPADYIAIQQLVNRLNFALDYCTNGGRDFADLFIAGGRYMIDTGEGDPAVRDTREALIALAGGPGCESRRTPPTSYILHLAESLVIEPTADGARGVSYAIYPSRAGKYLNDETAGQLGLYHDEYVRTPDGWRLRSRRHELNPAVGTDVF